MGGGIVGGAVGVASGETRLARAALSRLCEPGTPGLARLIAARGPDGALAALWHDGLSSDIAQIVVARRDTGRRA